jgi:cell division protein FtsB
MNTKKPFKLNKILISITVILFLSLIYLQYRLFFGKGSYQEYNVLNEMIEQQRQTNTALQIRNDMLKTEVANLKNGYDAIEERARLELGMIKRNEVFYQIVE